MEEFQDISSFIIYFSVCSFMGWVLESIIFRLYQDAPFKNAGFLYGPFVPVYGFGGVLIYASSFYLQGFAFPVVIVFCSIGLTALEYLTSLIMENVFSIKLWDYSKYRFNIKGRICLKLSIIWAILAAFQIRWFQPALINIITGFPGKFRSSFSAVLFLYFLSDLALSSRLYLRYSGSIRRLLTSEKHADLPGIFRMNLSIKDLKLLIRPMRQFPDLSIPVKRRWHRLSSLVMKKTGQWAVEFINLPGEKENLHKRWQTDEDFLKIAKAITDHPDYQRLKLVENNGRSVFDHNTASAYLAYRIAKELQMNEKAIVRGALLRNFEYFILQEELPDGSTLHEREYPDKSVKNAELLFGPISALEKDIIIKHRWPHTLIPPHYPEAIIVMIVDKIVSLRE